MTVKKFLETRVDCLRGITQEAVPQPRWPYKQDWIVSHIKWDSGNGMFWICGTIGKSGDSFHWGHDRNIKFIDGVPCIKLDWRYDLTNATYGSGRHETLAEAKQREEAERGQPCGS